MNMEAIKAAGIGDSSLVKALVYFCVSFEACFGLVYESRVAAEVGRALPSEGHSLLLQCCKVFNALRSSS